MLPRATEARDIPLPRVNSSALRKIARADAELAKTELPADTLELGTHIRAFFALQALTTASDDDVAATRRKMLAQLATATNRDGIQSIVALRAIQLELFLNEVERYQSTGKESKDLVELSGSFVGPMEKLGWIRQGKLLVDEAVFRVAYKNMWNAALNLGGTAPFPPTLEEQRALFAAVIMRPIAPLDEELAGLHKSAKTPAECTQIAERTRALENAARLDRVKKLSSVDPAYPKHYALGVAHFRAEQYPQAVQNFRDWLSAHPDGEYTSRARNFMREALRRESTL